MTRLLTLFAISFAALFSIFLAVQPSVAQTPQQAFLLQDQPTSTPQPTDAPPPTPESLQEDQPEGDRQGDESAVDWANVKMEDDESSYFPHAVPVPSIPAEPPGTALAPVEPEEGTSQPSDPATPTPATEAITYIVRAGETLYRIAKRHGISLAQLIAANNIQNPHRILVGQALIIPGPGSNSQITAASPQESKAQPNGDTYIVQRGDKPYEIAQRFGVSVELLMAINQIRNPRRLLVGQVLTIPQKGDVPELAATPVPSPQAVKPAAPGGTDVYVVQRGDYLFRIALSFGVPMQALIDANGLANPHQIYAGQILTIPRDKTNNQPDASTTQTTTEVTTSPPSGENLFIWPVPLQDGWIPQWYRAGHPGIDIILSEGTPIHAAAGGTVEFSGWNAYGFGNLVVINHGNGYRTLYAHQSERLVSGEDEVAQGDIIGLVGITGRATDPHLHFEIRQGNTPINPCNYLPGGCQ